MVSISKRLKVMKALFGVVFFAMVMSSCMSSGHAFESRGSSSRWRPVKDRTPYYKVVKVAERD